ncbi:MAG: prolyl oligopeptidase family serine peptidase [Chloroflexi bacterium]|nr:prolyl oligopeptidase family serine peptidase [Chloroflexota bacterium]
MLITNRSALGSRHRLVWCFVTLCLAGSLISPVVVLGKDPTKYQGTLADGKTTYLIFVPDNWNGTLFLYSHGLNNDPTDNPAKVSQDKRTQNWLLDHGYALAGGSYPTAGYDPIPFTESQFGVLDRFIEVVGAPTRTIAWGHSFGGSTTGYLVNARPERFDGALAICPFRLQGSVGNFNERLDHMFVLKTLLGFDEPLVNIGFGTGQRTRYRDRLWAVLDEAQQTATGRARLALAEAMVNTPQWGADPFNAFDVEPAAADYATRQRNQYLIARTQWFMDGERNFYEREIAKQPDLDTWDDPASGGDGSVSGANFSWNTGIDYADQLADSATADMVTALYAQAGLALDDDLATLAAAPRIAADPGAVEALQGLEPVFGDIGDVQVMTLALEADSVVWPNTLEGYADAIAAFGKSGQLRELWIHRSGHCQFTAAEQIVAIETLLARLDDNPWPSTTAADLNERAAALGSEYNRFVGVSSEFRGQEVAKFSDFEVPLFLRNFNAGTLNPYP